MKYLYLAFTLLASCVTVSPKSDDGTFETSCYRVDMTTEDLHTMLAEAVTKARRFCDGRDFEMDGDLGNECLTEDGKSGRTFKIKATCRKERSYEQSR